MTSKILNEVLMRLGSWPEDRQEQPARLLIEIQKQGGRQSHLTDEQAAEVSRRMGNPNRQFVALAGVREAFRKDRT